VVLPEVDLAATLGVVSLIAAFDVALVAGFEATLASAAAGFAATLGAAAVLVIALPAGTGVARATGATVRSVRTTVDASMMCRVVERKKKE
jgi:hypothetical protein